MTLTLQPILNISSPTAPLQLSQLLGFVGNVLNTDPAFSGVWITAETVDMRLTGGHCYMELVEKNEQTGAFIAKVRGTIWASSYNRLAAKFLATTGNRLATGMKVMVRVNVNFHSIYGLSLNIIDINPEYTLGDIERRRQETLRRLTAEGVIDMNKDLDWPVPLQRIAVISAEGAAGLGDFLKHLAENPRRLRFNVCLFPAVMQGDKCAASVISALDRIALESHNFDCVVIIRGGGATSDLVAFDDYSLALNVAQFPLPVISGVGHDRDVTVIDYVSKMHVKTPTAAAAWLISKGEEQLDMLRVIASDILQASTDRISGYRQQLAWYEAAIPARANTALQLAHSKIDQATVALKSLSDRNIRPLLTRLDAYAETLRITTANALQRATQRVDATEQLVRTLSPQATLRRGYTITRTLDGHAVTDLSSLAEGVEITTTFASGSVKSNITKIIKPSR